MGRHATAERRRGIAAWPLVAAGVVLILAAATVVYVLAVGGRDDADAAPCSGTAALRVLAGPGSAPAAGALVKGYNATAPNARSTCITGSVTPVRDGSTAADVLAKGWSESAGGPAVWLTDDPSQLAEVERRTPALTAGRAKDPVATSPVVLATPPGAALTEIAWSALLPAGATSPGLTLPNPVTNRASSYALQSALAPASGPLTAAGVRAAGPRLAGLRAAATKAPADTTAALQSLTAAGGTTAPVPVTEAELAGYNAARPQDQLTAAYPTGPTAGDVMYVVPLGGAWVDSTQSAAASGFASFVDSAAGKKALAAAHWRVPGGPAPSGPGIDPGTKVEPLPPAAPGVTAALAEALGFPAGSAAAAPSPAPATASTAGASSTAPPPDGTAEPPASTPAAGTPATASTAAPPPPSTPASGATTSATAPGTPTGPPPATPAPAPKPPATPAAASTSKPVPKPAPPAPEPSAATILLLDTSSAWDVTVDGQSRMAWLQQAVKALRGAGSRSVGLWTTSSRDDGGYAEVVPAGPLDGTVNGTKRIDAIAAAVDALEPGGGNRSYAAAPAALRWLSERPVDGRAQRVILVTADSDKTPSTSRAETISAVQEAIAGQQIRLDILGVGENAPDQALTDLAAAGGGSYTDVQQTPVLPDALAQVFSAT